MEAQGSMKVVPAAAPKQNGTSAPVAQAQTIAEKIAAKKQLIASLRDMSNKLGDEEAEYAKLCAEENAERARLEQEAADALKARAEIVETECYAALPDKGERTPLVCLYDRITEKRCGIGIVVVKAHEGDFAYKALQSAGKLTLSDKGEASFDALGTSNKSKVDIMNGLLKCIVYPKDPGAVDLLMEHGFGLARNAYAAASRLTGDLAQQTTGKSSS